MIRLLAVLLFLFASLAHANYIDEQTSTATTVQVSCTGSTGVVVAGGSRHAVTITNNSSVATYVCYAATCATTTGTLMVQGACITEQNYTGTISCITAGSTATLGVLVR